ncbi:MAG TPA: hypothetical protein VKG43_07360 [Acidimicrobiales bacterium]|nr:hypothetical protein [Acidimicrobiales bacterium]
MPADLSTWVGVLEVLEGRLAEYWRALSGQAPMPDPFSVPEGLGPLPPALVARARTLLAGQREVELQIRTRLGVLGDLLAGGGPLRVGGEPAYLDRHG